MSQNFFVYGPLGDPELLQIVLNRPIGADELVAARALRCVVRSSGGGWPALVRADGEAAAGALLLTEDPEPGERLAFFHGDGAQAERLTISASGRGEMEAIAFVQQSGAATGGAWSPKRWIEERRAFDLEFARDWMSQYGRRPAAEMEVLRTGIGFRAQSRASAAADCLTKDERGTTGLRSALGRRDVTPVSVVRPYMEFFSVEEHRLRHRRFDGKMSPELARTVFFSGDAVTILPYDAALDRVLMIEQWRAGPWARGDRRPWCLEVVAGRVDPDEAPEATAIREAREEAGVVIAELERIAAYYTTPGIAAEHLTAFVGRADLSSAGGVHGQPTEDEDIRTLTPSFDEAMAMLESGEVDNGPAIVSLLWLAAHRDRLRAHWT